MSTTTNSAAPQMELSRFQALTMYKQLLAEGDDSSPFTQHQVIRYGTNVEPLNVESIHEEVREQVERRVGRVRETRQSQLVILAGQPGAGKSHLLNSFRPQERSEQGRYILVCNSNHWKADEFEECLLDWILDALLKPTDTISFGEDVLSSQRGHLLLDKIRCLAYAAIDQLLAKPGLIRRYQVAGATGVWRRLGSMFLKSKRNEIVTLAQARNDRVFRLLRFGQFAEHFCDRFLFDTHNPFHRYVVHVLLRYLFTEDRPKVIHWLRSAQVEGSFFKKLGIQDLINRKYKAMDVIKILISLFSPALTDRLQASGGLANDDRVFFLAFDQIEGRDELFEDPSDWKKFFAQVSELYNLLPNVFIMFTMTLSSRDELYHSMEQQFRDRISREKKFVLGNPHPDDVLGQLNGTGLILAVKPRRIDSSCVEREIAGWTGALTSPPLASPQLNLLRIRQKNGETKK